MNKLPRRIRMINKVRDMYGLVPFTFSNTHVEIKLIWSTDSTVFVLHHEAEIVDAFTVRMTLAQFDNLYSV